MKKFFAIVIALAVVSVFLTSCAAAGITIEPVKSVAEIKFGETVGVYLAENDVVKVALLSGPEYIMGHQAYEEFQGGMFWVGKDGQLIDLQTAVRSSTKSLQGTWMYEIQNDGKKKLYVFALGAKTEIPQP